TRRRAASKVSLRSRLHQAPFILAGSATHHALFLDQPARNLGTPGAQVLTRARRVPRDVIVVGAGPGGLAAARALAADGRSVLVLEEHAIVGEPVHCTGLLGLEAFDELDLP